MVLTVAGVMKTDGQERGEVGQWVHNRAIGGHRICIPI